MFALAQAVSTRGQPQILGRAAQADKQMVIVRVDGGTPARKIGTDDDSLRLGFKGPALRVMTRRGKCRAAHEFMLQRAALQDWPAAGLGSERQVSAMARLYALLDVEHDASADAPPTAVVTKRLRVTPPACPVTNGWALR